MQDGSANVRTYVRATYNISISRKVRTGIKNAERRGRLFVMYPLGRVCIYRWGCVLYRGTRCCTERLIFPIQKCTSVCIISNRTQRGFILLFARGTTILRWGGYSGLLIFEFDIRTVGAAIKDGKLGTIVLG